MKTNKDDMKKILKILTLSDLHPKQEEIVASISNQFERSGTMSEKQEDLILDLYSRSNN